MNIVLLAVCLDGSTQAANALVFRSKMFNMLDLGDKEYVLCGSEVEKIQHTRVKYVEPKEGFLSWVKRQLLELEHATEVTIICSCHEWAAIQESEMTKPNKILRVSATSPIVWGEFDLEQDDVEIEDEHCYLSTIDYRTVKGKNTTLVWDGKKHTLHTVVFVPETKPA